jgi:hypothetical protein
LPVSEFRPFRPSVDFEKPPLIAGAFSFSGSKIYLLLASGTRIARFVP